VGGASVRLVAGEFGGERGPVTEIAAQPVYMDVTLQPGADFSAPLAAEHTAMAYVFAGEGLFGGEQPGAGEPVAAVRLAVFGAGDRLHVQAGPGAALRFMLMAGAPIKEPIFPYGPFVMNTEAEIRQALADLRSGTFVKDGAVIR
jgi:hypothetical protein